MAVRDEPVLGNWYHDADTEQEFQVVAYDEIGGIVEVRFDDGDVKVMELDEWFASDLKIIDPPDDWSVADPDDEDGEAWSTGRGTWDDDAEFPERD